MSTREQRAEILEKLITQDILSALLKDKTTDKNIIWATDDYATGCVECGFNDSIEVAYVTGKGTLIKPRIEKDKQIQSQRSRNKAEVFTPSWICNCQNNLIDNAWFKKERRRFNTEHDKNWETNYYPIVFPEKLGKTWIDYVKANRLEISCGEAPYLTSRYDTVTGKWIPVKNRIGLLDRKLRVISENVNESREWIKYAKVAVQSIYGFEWQGDSLFLARFNILASVIESYFEKYKKAINENTVMILAEIISWNIIQMDGMKFVIPNTCHEEMGRANLFGECEICSCEGCLKNDKFKHNGIYVKTMDWETKTEIRFIDILKGEKQ